MKALKLVVCLLGLSCAMLSQSGTPSAGTESDQDKISEKIKLLQDAMDQQQKQIQALQEELAQQKKARADAQVVNASYNVPNANNPAAAVQKDGDKPKESPLSVRIGGTDFTPGGFMDFNNIFRTVNTGNVVSTNFGGIPYSNTAQGHLTEFRSTGQYSRWNLKVAGKYGENNVTGFIEGDFNGNDAANVFVTTNPHTFRLRLYFLDLKRGKWEFLAGQAWSLLTPNRIGVSPMSSDLATTASTDGNIHVGVPYGRDGQFRVTVHPNDHFAWAVSIENPQQITNGEVVLPFAFNATLGTQVDGVATAGVPNVVPDIMTKMAWDTDFSGRHFHVEGGALMTSAKVTILPTGAPAFAQRSSIGGGFLGGLNVDLHKRLRVLAYGAYGNGVGRYFNGLGPEFVVRPIALTATTFDVATSMVHSGAGFGGFEIQTAQKTQFGVYYGGAYYQHNAFPDVTSPAVVKPTIGFGGTNSANSNNRAIQEGSLVWTQTLWRNPQYGAVLFINDASYSTRAPWFVAVGAPKNAHMFMDHLVLRYVLP